MFEEDAGLQDAEFDIVDVDIRAWVERARADPTLYWNRQVTEIVLASIGLTPTLSKTLVLKGGAVMALAFNSNRATGDVDFTSLVEPSGQREKIAIELNDIFPRAAVRLGYPDLICRVQGIKEKPRPQNFEGHAHPALLVRIGSAKRGSREEARLENGEARRVLDMEISFRDQVYEFQEWSLKGAGVSVRAFTLHELIAEKFRALIQQPSRNRFRRQDVYDIAFLIDTQHLTEADRSAILATLVKKCRNHGIDARKYSMDDPEVRARAEAEWNTLVQEIGKLPPFDERFTLMRNLYVSLPWDA